MEQAASKADNANQEPNEYSHYLQGHYGYIMQAKAIRHFCHQLNNPLAAIKGFAQIVAMTQQLDEKGKKFIENIDTATDKMSLAIDQTSKLTKLNDITDLGEYSPLEIITRAMDCVGSKLDSIAAKVWVKASSPFNQTRGHLGQLTSILSSLLWFSYDAFEASTVKGPKIEITIDQLTPNTLVMTYSDNSNHDRSRAYHQTFGIEVKINQDILKDINGKIDWMEDDSSTKVRIELASNTTVANFEKIHPSLNIEQAEGVN